MVLGWWSLDMPNWQLQDRCNTSFLGANAQRTTVSKGQKQDLESFLHWLLICLNVSYYPSLNGRLVSHLTKNVGSGELLVWGTVNFHIHNSRIRVRFQWFHLQKTIKISLKHSHYKGSVGTIHFYIGIVLPFCHLFQPQNPILASVAISYWPKSWIQRPTIWETVNVYWSVQSHPGFSFHVVLRQSVSICFKAGSQNSKECTYIYL